MRKYFLLLILCGFTTVAFAQTGTIRGFVYFKKTAEPSLFTTVYLKGTTIGAVSDVNGYFSITKIPPGTYDLLIISLGYDTITENISVKAGDIITKKYYQVESSLQLQTVEVSAEKQEKQEQVKISVNKITAKELKLIPTVGGEPDLAQYLQVLPGVVFTGDQGGQLYIRGGVPVQNKVLLDGMIVYNPFHSIGLFSVFDADIIRNADVYTGGFGAQYGGRISSVMDITTRDGNKKHFGGKVSASPFGAKLLLEGPIKKAKEDNSGSSSFVLSAKTSYLPTTSKVVYSYVDTAGLPFSFNDYYGKYSASSSNGSKFNLFGFRFTDRVRYQALSNLEWKAFGGGSNFLVIPSSSTVLIKGNFSYSSYKIGLKEDIGYPRNSQINGFNLGLGFTYFIGKSEIEYGIEGLGFKTDFQLYNSVGRKINQTENTTEIAGYIRSKIISKNRKFLIEPGFRAHYYASLSNFSPEPRLGAKYNITDFLRVKFAGGYYAQNLISATSERDVVNLFYGFLSGSENIPTEFTNQDGTTSTIDKKLQRANHLIAGFEIDLFKYIDVNIEAYQKNFTQLTNLNRNKLFDDTPENHDKPDYLKKDFIIETGSAKGIDLLVKYEYKNLYIWTVYSLGFVKRWDGLVEYRPHFDRRHNANLVVAYKFGKKRKTWEVNVRWNYGSGFPFSPTGGFYEKLTFPGGINENYTTANGELGYYYGEQNSKQLPDYHRMDFNIKKRFDLKENVVWEINAGATNAYNRANIFYFDRVTYKRVNQLPILPSLSMSLTF